MKPPENIPGTKSWADSVAPNSQRLYSDTLNDTINAFQDSLAASKYTPVEIDYRVKQFATAIAMGDDVRVPANHKVLQERIGLYRKSIEPAGDAPTELTKAVDAAEAVANARKQQEPFSLTPADFAKIEKSFKIQVMKQIPTIPVIRESQAEILAKDFMKDFEDKVKALREQKSSAPIDADGYKELVASSLQVLKGKIADNDYSRTSLPVGTLENKKRVKAKIDNALSGIANTIDEISASKTKGVSAAL